MKETNTKIIVVVKTGAKNANHSSNQCFFLNCVEVGLDKIKLSKKITHSSLNEKVNDTEYWRSKSPEERFEAIELLKQIFYNYDPAAARLLRVIKSAELRKS